MIPNYAPQRDGSDNHTVTLGHVTSNHETFGVAAHGPHQVIHGLIAVDALLAHIRRCPLYELTRMPTLAGDPGQQAKRGLVRRENIAPKAKRQLCADLDPVPGSDVEEIHAGSFSGTLTRALRSGTTNRRGAGCSSGTSTRRLSGLPISAIDHSFRILTSSFSNGRAAPQFVSNSSQNLCHLSSLHLMSCRPILDLLDSNGFCPLRN